MKNYRIRLGSPDVNEDDINAVAEVLRTPNLSNGPKVREFEKRIASYIGTNYAIGVANGTAGLHLSLLALGIGPGDEVITTPFTFISTANAITYVRAIPIFVDINPRTLNIDTTKISDKICSRTKAILPVHIFGQSCNMDPILEMANNHGLQVIEDACEAIGAEYKNRKVGSFGNCGVFAFYPNKQITTGEGGIITTNDSEIMWKCRMLLNHGRNPSMYLPWYTERGYNYKMSDIHAALGLSQLERIDEILDRRSEIARMYSDRLEGKIRTLNFNRSWFSYMVILPEGYTRDNITNLVYSLADRGIETSSYFPPIHLQPFYKERYYQGKFPITESISGRIIALPFHLKLTRQNIDDVCGNLLAEINRGI